MDKKERIYWEKRLVAGYHQSTKKLQSFPAKDVESVRKLILKQGELGNDSKKPKHNFWNARLHEQEGRATDKEKQILKQYSSEIINFIEILDAWMLYFKYRLIFLIHQKGADLVETANIIGKHLGEEVFTEELDKEIRHLLRDEKNIN